VVLMIPNNIGKSQLGPFPPSRPRPADVDALEAAHIHELLL
jgi:hypothetical protein